MIRRIHLYLFWQILVAFLFSGVAVTFVVLFTQSFRMLSFVIDNSGSIGVFFRLMALLIPTFLPLIVPLSLGVAVLFIYQKLVVDSEIVVMRAAGLSPMRLATPALVLAVLAVLFGYFLTVWVAPAANRSLVALQYRIRDDFSALTIKPGVFNDLEDGLTFYARKRGREGGFEGILVHDVRAPQRPVTIMAERGRLFLEKGTPEFVVLDGRRQEVDVESGRLQELLFDRYVLDLGLLRDGAADRSLDARELSLRELEVRMASAEEAKARNQARTEWHQRLAAPLLALTFTAIALAVILAGEFNRRGMARRVVSAAIGIVVVQAAMISLVTQIAKYDGLVPVLYFVILLPIPVCLFFLDAPASLFHRVRAAVFAKRKQAC